MLAILARAVGALACLSVAATSAAAQTGEAAFFKGKTVRIVVGFAAGGGYDLYARIIAPHLGKRLDANVVVENQPGAGGLTALNRVNAAPPDGLTLMLANGAGAALAQISDSPGVRFDIAKMSHLGAVSTEPWVWLVSSKSPVRTVADAMKMDKDKEIHWAASGPMDGLSDGAVFTCAALRLRCKVITGYKGSRESANAVMQMEMDALYVADTSANNYTLQGDARVIASVNRKRSRFYPDVPTVFEAGLVPDENAWMIDFHAATEDLSRILVLPPNMPPARLAYMQGVVKDILTDKDFIAEGERTQRYIGFVDAPTTARAVSRVVSDLTPERLQQVKRMLDLTTR